MLCKEIIWIFVIWQVFYFEFDTSHKTILSNGKEKFVLAGVEVELGMDNDKFECLESLPHY